MPEGSQEPRGRRKNPGRAPRKPAPDRARPQPKTTSTPRLPGDHGEDQTLEGAQGPEEGGVPAVLQPPSVHPLPHQEGRQEEDEEEEGPVGRVPLEKVPHLGENLPEKTA